MYGPADVDPRGLGDQTVDHGALRHRPGSTGQAGGRVTGRRGGGDQVNQLQRVNLVIPSPGPRVNGLYRPGSTGGCGGQPSGSRDGELVVRRVGTSLSASAAPELVRQDADHRRHFLRPRLKVSVYVRVVGPPVDDLRVEVGEALLPRAEFGLLLR